MVIIIIKLKERLARGDPGKNPLENFCKDHNIVYTESNSLTDRHQADSILENRAYERGESRDATFGEKLLVEL